MKPLTPGQGGILSYPATYVLVVLRNGPFIIRQVAGRAKLLVSLLVELG